MTELEYQEHIQQTHNAFCKVVIRHAAIDMATRQSCKMSLTDTPDLSAISLA